MSVSLWQQAEQPRRLSVDLAIVGSGIAGLSAALEATRQGLRVALLERGQLGCGASGRNAGFLMRGADDNYAAAINHYGRPAAKALWQRTEENLAALRAEGIEQVPGYAPTPSCLLALDHEEEQALRASLDLLREDGFAADSLTPDADDIAANPSVRFGLINPNDATCQPMRVLEWLASKLPDGTLRTNQAVHAIKTDDASGRLMLATTSLRVDADHALICANAWLPTLVPALAGVIVPNRGQMIALHAGADECRFACAYYAHHGGEYFRRVDANTIIVGGCRRFFEEQERTEADATAIAANVQDRLEDFAAEILGKRFPIRTRWAGMMAFTPNHLPITGPTDDPRLWVCGGFTGHGMSLGYITAKQTIQAMLNKITNPPFPLGSA